MFLRGSRTRRSAAHRDRAGSAQPCTDGSVRAVRRSPGRRPDEGSGCSSGGSTCRRAGRRRQRSSSGLTTSPVATIRVADWYAHRGTSSHGSRSTVGFARDVVRLAWQTPPVRGANTAPATRAAPQNGPSQQPHGANSSVENRRGSARSNMRARPPWRGTRSRIRRSSSSRRTTRAAESPANQPLRRGSSAAAGGATGAVAVLSPQDVAEVQEPSNQQDSEDQQHEAGDRAAAGRNRDHEHERDHDAEVADALSAHPPELT